MPGTEYSFHEDVELDAMIFFASIQKSTAKFREMAASLGITNPVEGIARGLWLGEQPKEYKLKVFARFKQILGQAQVVN